MITLTSLSKIYRTDEIETVALENVNLTVDRGEFLSIMGPSGCGKSTLLNIMGLLDAPTTGTVEINGTHTEGMKDKQLAAFRNKTLGFVFQSFHLINSLNVMDNVEHPAAQAKLGMLICLAVHNGAQIIIESHSDHILNSLRYSFKKGILTNEQAKVLFIRRIIADGKVYPDLDYIEIKENGKLSHRPDDFFDTWDKMLTELI